jgi:hypothetical protein
MRRFNVFLCVATTTLLIVSSAKADSKAEWKGYVWRDVPMAYCPGSPQPDGYCNAISFRFNGAKKHFIDHWYRIDDDSGAIKIHHSAYNDERIDGFTVCFTTIFADGDAKPLYVFHKKWGVDATPNRNGERRTEEYSGRLPPNV